MGNRCKAYSFSNFGTRCGWVVNARIRPIYSTGMIHYPLYRRLGGSKDRDGRVLKFSPNLGFNPRTFQPIATLSLLLTKRMHITMIKSRERGKGIHPAFYLFEYLSVILIATKWLKV